MWVGRRSRPESCGATPEPTPSWSSVRPCRHSHNPMPRPSWPGSPRWPSTPSRSDDNALGLAIAICGPFDLDAGESRMRGVAKFEDIYGIDLRSALRRRTRIGDRPIRFARDAESAGTGEALIGAGKRRRPGADDHTRHRHGHVRDRSCLAGRVHRRLRRRAPRDAGHADGTADPTTCCPHAASPIGSAYRWPTSRRRSTIRPTAEVVFDHGHRIGEFLAPVIVEFDVQLLVIGGGLSAAFDRFGPAIQSHLDVPVRPIALGAAGPLLGAVHLTFS